MHFAHTFHPLQKTAIFFLTIATLVSTPSEQPLLLANDTRATFDFTPVAKKATPAVVSVRTKIASKLGSNSNSLGPFQDDIWERFFGIPKQFQQPEAAPLEIAQASGFLVSADGHILTNAHVVKDSHEITVLLNDGREYPAKLIGQDSTTDVAVIKIEGKEFPYLTLADSSKLEVGQWVAAVGNPLGLQASLTVGVCSAKGRSNLDLAALEDFIQTDAAINRGNSGGPLLNLDSEVVGMNTAIASNTGGYMGIGFAIPSNMTKYVMEQLLQHGSVTRGFLGVVLQQVTYDYAIALGMNKVEGALVAEVQENSPAAKAGLKRGDVIVKYDDLSVDNVGTFRNAVSVMKPDTELTLTVIRNKEIIPLKVIVGTFPKSGVAAAEPNSVNLLGIQVQDVTPEIAKRFGYTHEEGVVISEVLPNSAAAWIGLKRGSLIMEVNQQPITSAERFNQLVSEFKAGGSVLLLVRQDGVTRYVALTLR